MTLINRHFRASSDTELLPIDRTVTMFRHRRQRHRWAAVMLFMWFFGLAAGIANACLATGQDLGLGPDAPQQHAHRDGAVADNDGDGVHEHRATPVYANCHDFCGKAAESVPLLKSALDDVHAHFIAAVATNIAFPVPALAPARPWSPRRDVARAMPIFIALLRLAL